MAKINKKGKIKSADNPSLLKIKLKSAKKVSEFAENIINTVREPLIVLDKDLIVVKASQSFYDFFKVTPGETIGTLIYNLGNNQWDIPKLRKLLETILPEKTTFDNFEVEHVFSSIGKRIMLLNARKIQRGSGKEQIILAIEDITQRKRAEEEVRESEERFRMVFENVFDGISIYNEDPDPSKRKLIECNERYSILAGRSRDELLQLGSTIGLQITLEDKANVNRLESIDRGIAYQGYFSWIRPDGKENVIEYVGMPIKWRGKSYSIGIDRDITDRKRAEEALRESQSLYHSFIEQLPNPVFRKDREGRYVLVNSQFCRLKGLKKEDFIGRKPMEVEINELEKQGGQEQATKYANVGEDIHELIMRTGKLIEKEEEYPGTNGGKQFMQVVRMPVFDFYGTVIGTQGIMFDISERKRAEEEIIILVQSLRSVNECVSITDMKDKLIFVNQSFLNAYGYSEDELIGKQISMVRSPNNPPELIAEILSAALHGGWKGELWNKRKDGSEFLIYLSTTIINDKDGKHLGLIGVATDITERKRTEQELIEAKEKAESANKLKDAFIANISHEIRTPLNGILGISSIIRDTFHDQMKEEDEVLFEGIDFSSKRIIRTIDMILNYSRLQVGEFQIKRKDMELSPICENLVKEFTVPAKFKSLKLIYENKYENVIIFADEYSVILAISNLIDNAIKYTNKGFINVILRKGNNDDIILDVKDTGIGINEKYLENMFEPFRQEQMGYGRAYEGLGLGLSLVKQILALNNAKVFVESKKGEGTTFSINFGKEVQPFEKMAEKEITANIPPVSEKYGTEVVLIVEDDIINQTTIKRFIGNKYITIITDSSDEALKILKKKKVDIILMDISIRGKKNGLELTKELKASKEFSYIPIIAITAHAFEEDKQNALGAGCDGFLAKPFSKESLFDMITGYADKSKSEKGI